MLDTNLTQYLGNILLVGTVDGKVETTEGRAIVLILAELGAGIEDLNLAADTINQGKCGLEPVGRFSERVRNLEDMVLVAVADGSLPPEEKDAVLSFARDIRIGQEQLKIIIGEARKRAELLGL
jgi:hypothetical protein